MKASSSKLVALASALALAACSSSSTPSQDSGAGEDGGGASSSSSGGSSGTSSGGSSSGSSGGLADAAPETSSGGGSSSGSSSSSGGGKQVGDPCTSDSQCPGISLSQGTCMTSWPGGGACTIVGCAGSCPGSGTWCTNYQGQTYCAPSCQPGIVACNRAGYVCSGGGCVPGGDGG